MEGSANDAFYVAQIEEGKREIKVPNFRGRRKMVNHEYLIH